MPINPHLIVSYGLFPQMQVDYVYRRYRRLHVFIRTILQEHWGLKSPKVKNKLRRIPASEFGTHGKISERRVL